LIFSIKIKSHLL